MDNPELLHESFNYDNFFGENIDDYHTMNCIESINSTNENNHETPIKNRVTGI
jgi:hypothetical protein